MPPPVRDVLSCVDARYEVLITDDGSPTLVDRALGDAMHSGCGAVAESRHVYLENSGVSHRLAAELPTRVLEVGLGAGLNWLLTADEAIASSTPLAYVGLESQLPSGDAIRQLRFERFVRTPVLVDRFCDFLDRCGRETSRLEPAPAISLQVNCRDAIEWSCDPSILSMQPFDAIYFDPYSPSTNPDLWSADFLAVIRGLLAPDGRLVSYCVSTPVRRVMQSVGFETLRARGPAGGKREVLIARPHPA